MKDQNLQRKIRQLQSMLGEINRYLQGSASKPPGIVTRLLDEKSRLTSQLRELNNMFSGKADEMEGVPGNQPLAQNMPGKLDKGESICKMSCNSMIQWICVWMSRNSFWKWGLCLR
ncbi:hypothetical protein NERG_01294 [Nematocida ausubeli]|uniref:Uncharacterized protein n=1 Tax=Nematocida ausubeli (strain ATCC PRA-371 / ERTm2) TaxID=1913371 RepID=H8ZC51_NEMA1|nr:hypothetical protein NERG_01294 [Nematocida ausubeli]